MAIVKKLLDNLVAQYGPDEGRRVYDAMRAEAKGPFAPGNKHHDQHEAWAMKNGVPPAMKKPQPARCKAGAGVQRRR